MAALVAEAGPGGASGARALAAMGKDKTRSTLAESQDAGAGQVVTGPEGAPSSKGIGKAVGASAGARVKDPGEVVASTGEDPSTDRGKAVAASAATDDDDEAVITKVFHASEQYQTPMATAGGATGTTAGVLVEVSSAASAAALLGYKYDGETVI